MKLKDAVPGMYVAELNTNDTKQYHVIVKTTEHITVVGKMYNRVYGMDGKPFLLPGQSLTDRDNMEVFPYHEVYYSTSSSVVNDDLQKEMYESM